MLFPTEVRPVALIVTVRSCGPGLGVALQTMNEAAVEPTPVGRKTTVSCPPLSAIFNPVGSAEWRNSTPLSDVRMIQPCSHDPVPQALPFDDTQSVMGEFRLIASLRASCALLAKSFAKDASLLPKSVLSNAGIAIETTIPRMAIVTINSTSVKPCGVDVRTRSVMQGSRVVIAEVASRSESVSCCMSSLPVQSS